MQDDRYVYMVTTINKNKEESAPFIILAKNMQDVEEQIHDLREDQLIVDIAKTSWILLVSDKRSIEGRWLLVETRNREDKPRDYLINAISVGIAEAAVTPELQNTDREIKRIVAISEKVL